MIDNPKKRVRSLARALAAFSVLGALAACDTTTTQLVTADPRAAVRYGLPPVPPSLVPDVVWAETPDARALRAAYPARANSLGLGGSAGMECEVGEGGRLGDCELVDELPAGFGFGPAVLSLAPEFKAEPRARSGEAITAGRRVRVGVRFTRGGREEQVGLCHAIALRLNGGEDSPAQQDAAAADLAARAPLLLDRSAAARHLRELAPIATTLVREQPASAERMAEGCLGRPRLEGEPNRAYPEAARLRIDPNGEAHVVRRPSWTAVPRAEEVARLYPPAAIRQDVDGRGVVQCRVSVTGVLSDCVVVEDTPPGFGFGNAALSLTPRFRMSPELVDGRPVESVATVPVIFALPR